MDKIRNFDRYATAQDAIDAWNSMSEIDQRDYGYITEWLYAEAGKETRKVLS